MTKQNIKKINPFIIPGIKPIYKTKIKVPPIEDHLIILNSVSEYFNIPIKDIKKITHKRDFSHPRMIAVYLMCNMTTLSLNQIAKVLTNDGDKTRHYSTMINARESIKESCQVDISCEREVSNIISIIEEKFKSIHNEI